MRNQNHNKGEKKKTERKIGKYDREDAGKEGSDLQIQLRLHKIKNSGVHLRSVKNCLGFSFMVVQRTKLTECL